MLPHSGSITRARPVRATPATRLATLAVSASLLAATAPGAGAQRTPAPTPRPAPAVADTTAPAPAAGKPEPLFGWRDAAVLGAGALGTILVIQVDEPIARALHDSSVRSEGLDDFATSYAWLDEHKFFYASLGSWAVGRLAGWETVADIGLHAAEANILATTFVSLVRNVTGRSRPVVTEHTDAFDFDFGRGFDGGPYRSFPSLHTTGAFAVAAVVTEETLRRRPRLVWLVGPVAYLTAFSVGVGRMYTDQHWASDVAAAALLGTFTGIKVVRWHHTHDDRFDRWLLGAAAGSQPRTVLLTIGRRF